MSDQPKPTFTEERRQKAERDPIGDYGVCQPEPSGSIEARITDYLASGGLFNPELADHDAVSRLLFDCREQLAAERKKVKAAEGAVFAARMLDERQVSEKVQTLVDALERAEGAIRSEDHVKMGLALVVIRDRLAKVKEGQK